MGQNWWWVAVGAAAVVALLVAVALMRAQRRRTGPPHRSDVEIAAAAAGGAAGAVGAGAVAAVRAEEPTEPAGASGAAGEAASSTSGDPDQEGAGAAPDPAGDTPRPVDAPPAEPGGADEPDAPADGPASVEERSPARSIPDPADSALAALDTGLVGPARAFAAAAAAVSAVASQPGPFPGSLLPAADGSAPTPDHVVKANEGSRRYHTPDSPYYVRTRGDVWFRTAEEARAAGFTAWDAGRSRQR